MPDEILGPASLWIAATRARSSRSLIISPSAVHGWVTQRPALTPVSPKGTTAQEGRVFQAGAPFGSVKARSAAGRCVAAITAVTVGGRSAAKASWKFAGLIANSVAVSASCLVGSGTAGSECGSGHDDSYLSDSDERSVKRSGLGTVRGVVSPGARRSIPVDVDERLGKGLRGFLWQVMPDAALDNPVRVRA